MCLRRTRLLAAAGPARRRRVGGLATDPDSGWFRRLDKPAWYPPPQTFGVVWTASTPAIGWASGEVLARSSGARRRSFARAYAANLALNTAWTPLFFRAHRPAAAAVESAALTASIGRPGAAGARGQRAGRRRTGAVRAVDGVRDGAVGRDRPAQPPLIRTPERAPGR